MKKISAALIQNSVLLAQWFDVDDGSRDVVAVQRGPVWNDFPGPVSFGISNLLPLAAYENTNSIRADKNLSATHSSPA